MSISLLVQYNLKPTKKTKNPCTKPPHSRLVPNCKRRHLSKLFSFFQSHRTLHTATVTDYLQVTSDDLENERKGIDFNALFKSCTKLQQVKCAHTLVLVSGRFKDNFLSSKIVNLYSQHGDVSLAWWTFHHLPNKDVYTWNSMAFAYVSHGRFREALGCFNQFFSTSGLRPDFYTFPPVVKACGDLLDGKKIHCLVLKLGFEWDVFVAASLNGNAAEALDIADEMRLEGVKMDAITVASVLPVCAQMQEARVQPDLLTLVSLASIVAQLNDHQNSRSVHGFVMRKDVFVGTCLIDMYGKCGKLDDAISLFYQVPRKNSVPWNAMISCYGVHGDGEKALELFREMRAERVKPDHITFVSLLSACSHSGLVSDAQWCFNMMEEEIHGNIELGKHASERLFEVDSENVGYYVLLSNIYANVGKWEGVDDVRSLARDRGLRKNPGWSSIILNNKVDVFYTGNQTHPKCEEIYRELRDLTSKIKTIGYVPDFCFVLQDVEEDEKEHILMGHTSALVHDHDHDDGKFGLIYQNARCSASGQTQTVLKETPTVTMAPVRGNSPLHIELNRQIA
ncbi:hypothetical protein D5086_003918 [Populus alba]|uniref:Uncharacterized protein n=1 Tax=Populus alba TaxID=43335 RepID=A0ACC4D672_POPAL